MSADFDFTSVRFAVVASDLAVIRWGDCSRSDVERQAWNAGEKALELPDDDPPAKGRVLDLESGRLVDPPA